MKSVVAAGCVALAVGTFSSAQTSTQAPSRGTTQAGSGSGVKTDPATQGTTDRAGQSPQPVVGSDQPSGSVGTTGTREPGNAQGTGSTGGGTGATSATGSGAATTQGTSGTGTMPQGGGTQQGSGSVAPDQPASQQAKKPATRRTRRSTKSKRTGTGATKTPDKSGNATGANANPR
jgi:hypothetical protein